MPNTRSGRGTPCASSTKVAMPSASAPAASTSVSTLPSRMSRTRRTRDPGGGAGAAGGWTRESFDGATFTAGSSSGSALAKPRAGGARASGQAIPRTTGMSRSRIFLRSVLRFSPSMAAALIWLPRVAARVSWISGRSTSAST